jgi:dihydroorotase
MSGPRLVIGNVRLLDPASGLDATGAITMEDGVIVQVSPGRSGPAPHGAFLDGQGLALSPGFIDMRVFTGEPGSEHRETLASAAQSAAAGGVTTMAVMPNTDPVIDDIALVDLIKTRAAGAQLRILPAAALTKGHRGEAMTEIGLLQEAGAAFFTDPLSAIRDTLVLKRCMSYAANFGALIATHTEDPWLAAGVATEGEYAARLGLSGNPAYAELIGVQRDLALAEATGVRLHIAQVSTAAALDAIRQARARGQTVTCAVSGHHLALNERDVEQYKTFAKVSPPLRPEADRLALLEGVRDGTVDAIVSSHDPQAPEAKRLPFAQATPGATGLETLLPAALTAYHGGGASLLRVVEALTAGPARILGLRQGRLHAGAPADLTLFDPDAPVRIDAAKFRSHSKNSPFQGRLMSGRVVRTFVGGKTVFANP